MRALAAVAFGLIGAIVVIVATPMGEPSGAVMRKSYTPARTATTEYNSVDSLEVTASVKHSPAKYELQVGERWVTVTRMEFYKYTEGDKWPRN